MIKTEHPIVNKLAGIPEWDFRLIGSRRYALTRPHTLTDWDFIVSRPARRWADNEEKMMFEALGFKKIAVGGYSLDRYATHYRWTNGDAWIVDVDVLVVSPEEMEMRLTIYPQVTDALRRTLKGTWQDFFDVVRPYYKSKAKQ